MKEVFRLNHSRAFNSVFCLKYYNDKVVLSPQDFLDRTTNDVGCDSCHVYVLRLKFLAIIFSDLVGY